MDPRTLTTYQGAVRTTAQRRLIDIWLSLPKGEERENFYYEFLCSTRTPEQALAAWAERAAVRADAERVA